MNISIGQNCLSNKKTFEYIVPPPTNGIGTIIIFSDFFREFRISDDRKQSGNVLKKTAGLSGEKLLKKAGPRILQGFIVVS